MGATETLHPGSPALSAASTTPASSPEEFRSELGHGSLYLGSPETVARKLATTIQTLGIQRFDLKYSAGTLPHEQLLCSIELYGSKVVPIVKDLLA